MTDLVVETPEGVALRFELAGAGTRVLAAVLDGLVLAAFLFVAGIAFAVVGLGIGALLLASGIALVFVAYWVVFSLALGGRTLGKYWTGIRVCDVDGATPGAAQVLLRSLFVPFEAVLVVPVPLTWLLMALTPRHQRLGDLVAGTVVLRDARRGARREPAAGLTWSKLGERRYHFEPVQALDFDGRDLGFLRDLLARSDIAVLARGRLYQRAASHVAARLGWGEREFRQEEARDFLREFFLFLREMRAAPRVTPARPADGAAGRDTPRAGAPLRR